MKNLGNDPDSDKIGEFRDDFVFRLECDPSGRTRATLCLDGQAVSSGLWKRGKTESLYWPKEGSNLNTFPSNGGMLKDLDSSFEYHLTGFQVCPSQPEHYHFQIEQKLTQ